MNSVLAPNNVHHVFYDARVFTSNITFMFRPRLKSAEIPIKSWTISLIFYGKIWFVVSKRKRHCVSVKQQFTIFTFHINIAHRCPYDVVQQQIRKFVSREIEREREKWNSEKVLRFKVFRRNAAVICCLMPKFHCREWIFILLRSPGFIRSIRIMYYAARL